MPRLTRHGEAYLEVTRHPRAEVARWALDAVADLDVAIERERKRDEEQEFGIFRWWFTDKSADGLGARTDRSGWCWMEQQDNPLVEESV